MRSMCGADAGCLAINYQSLSVVEQGGEFLPGPERQRFLEDSTFEDLSGWTINRFMR